VASAIVEHEENKVRVAFQVRRLQVAIMAEQSLGPDESGARGLLELYGSRAGLSRPSANGHADHGPWLACFACDRGGRPARTDKFRTWPTALTRMHYTNDQHYQTWHTPSQLISAYAAIYQFSDWPIHWISREQTRPRFFVGLSGYPACRMVLDA